MMSKIKGRIQILLFTGIACLIFSCIDQDEPEAVSVLTIQVKMPDGFKEEIKYAHKTVVLKSNRMTYTAITDANGVARLSDIIPDIYSISTSWEIDGNTYVSMVNSVVENKDVVLSGNLTKEKVFASGTIGMQLSKATKQSLIISKIYSSGTRDNNNKTYRADAYVEIFNNSDETQYLDSTLYLGFVEAESVIAYPAAANPGYVYARQVFRFTGTSEKIAVLPGKSLVIANSAIDHTKFASNSVNLSNADFEAKNTIYSNNSNVKELPLVYTSFASLQYMNLVNGGFNGTFLFKTTGNVSAYPVFYIPGKETGNRFMRIPVQYVFDGVETLKNEFGTGPNLSAKRLPGFVDAGYMFINAISGYTNESIERRVDTSGSTAERYYLIDTNNSLNDFRTVTDPTPRKYDKALLIAN